MAYLPNTPEGSSLNPDKVVQILFYFHDQAHFNHLQTSSYARHKALDGLYTGLEEFKDGISELLLGYIAPKRLMSLPKLPVVKMSDEKLLDELCKFADELYEYGETTKWWALSNQAAEVSGLGYKTKYLLTLS